MLTVNSAVAVSTCTFSANTATSSGGGMYCSGSTPTVTGCTFSNNTAANGGGLNSAASTVAVSTCTFASNTATAAGGGVSGGAGSVTSCTFTSNTATSGGGIAHSGSGAISGCTFSANGAVTGGALYVTAGGGSAPTVTGCTFTSNTATAATSTGGGVFYNSPSGGTLTHCILWGNTTPANANDASREELYKAGTGVTLTVSSCIIRDRSATATNNYTAGTGIRVADPRFVDAADPDGPDNTWRTADDGLALTGCSAAIDAGDPAAAAPPTDILGNARVGTYDLGAYEYQGTATTGLAATGATATATASAGYNGGFGACGAVIADLASAGASPVSGSVTAQVAVQGTTPTSTGGQPYVRRFYDIRPVTNPDGATANITLYFTQADFNDYNINRGIYPSLPVDAADAANNRANLRITQQHGTSTTGLPGSYTGWAGSGPANVLLTPSSVLWNATLSRWEVSFPITGFSGFFAHTVQAATPLPVGITAFTARAAGPANALSWSIAVAEGSSFAVERSATGSGFTAIGRVKGESGGTSYSFEDGAPAATSYYRLRVLAADGEETYSPVALVRRGVTGSSTVTLAPQPATGSLVVTNTDTSQNGSTATVLDVQGREVARFILAPSVTLDVSRWAPGFYALCLSSGEVLRLVRH